MHDLITELCTKLLQAEETAELQPVAAQLRNAIRRRLESVRNHAIRIAVIDHMVDLDFLITTPAKEKPN